MHKFIEAYDRTRTFFYLDPTNYQAPIYAHNLELAGYRQIAEILAGVKGKFILSINGHRRMRETSNGFNISPVSQTYTISKGSAETDRELLVRNF